MAINQMIADLEVAIGQDTGDEYHYSVPVEVYKAHKIAVDYMRRVWPWYCNEYRDIAIPSQPNNGLRETSATVSQPMLL